MLLTVFAEFSEFGNRLLTGEIHPPRNSKYVLPPFPQDRPISYCQAIQRSLAAPTVNTEPEKVKVTNDYDVTRSFVEYKSEWWCNSQLHRHDINKTKIMSESRKEIYMFLNWTYLEVQKSEEVHPDKRISPWPHVHQHYCECMPQEQQIDKECESLQIVEE